MLFLNWFTSRSVRHAWQAANHVEKILHHQRDLLAPPAVEAVQAGINDLRGVCRHGDQGSVRVSLGKLEEIANENLKPYPHAAWRENIEVALVAIAVAMAIRTFVLQPFKIPTGSMQPTLYGVTYEDLRGTKVEIPGQFRRLFDYWFRGVQYFHVVAPASGRVTYGAPSKLVLFNSLQKMSVEGAGSTVWFPPDNLFERSGIFSGMSVKAGEDLIKMRVVSGDHLFVDRITYNFRRPQRGEVVVFETHGITRLDPSQQDTYYIKRLCGLGGENLRLTNDQYVTNIPSPENPKAWAGRLVVNDRPLTASTPPFENLYSFPDYRGGTNRVQTYHENHYIGHGLLHAFAPGSSYIVPPDHYFVMGDNTFNSSDSRYWGDFPQEKVIGKSFFVYWPIGGTSYRGEERPSRFGWSHR